MTSRNTNHVAMLLLLLLSAFTTAGCGEAYPDQARTYITAAHSALIAQGLCSDANDCSKRNLVFWEGGNPWIPSMKKVFISMYGVKDPAVVDSVAKSIIESKASIGGPPCLLTAYSTNHRESKVTFKEVAIN